MNNIVIIKFGEENCKVPQNTKLHVSKIAIFVFLNRIIITTKKGN